MVRSMTVMIGRLFGYRSRDPGLHLSFPQNIYFRSSVVSTSELNHLGVFHPVADMDTQIVVAPHTIHIEDRSSCCA